jgi:hypothetical protein
MTREEQIEKAAKRYVKDIVTPIPASLTVTFEKGAMWADEHPVNYDGKAMLHVLNKGAAVGRREMLDKACEWLKKSTILADTTIERFKKEMEE